MSVKIEKTTLENENFKFNCFHFIPQKVEHMALFTHGYTASKADCISWASRLSDNGFACSIFDLPGHLLGSFNEVASFDVFAENAHHSFIDVYHDLLARIENKPENLLLGGHSLGALLALKALNFELFSEHNLAAVGVGLGQNLNMKGHLFTSDFYEKTLNIRKQLVAESLNPDIMFPWIMEEKEKLNLSGKRIHLITGKDDVVVGPDGMAYLEKRLSEKNTVSSIQPSRLPHHEPTHASPHIFSFVKKEFL